jgi:hypothetical protein
MRASKYEFFRNGVDNQKVADISISFRRSDIKKIAKWTPGQRRSALKYLKIFKEQAEVFFNSAQKEFSKPTQP